MANCRRGYDVVGTRRHVTVKIRGFVKRPPKMINAMITKATGRSMGDYGCMFIYRRHIIDAMLQCHERSTFIPILANTLLVVRLKLKSLTLSVNMVIQNTVS